MVAWNMSDRRVAVLSGARTPFAKAGGALKDVHAADLGKRAIQETLYRANWPADDLDEVILGNVVMPVDATNLARVAAIWAGVPVRVPGLTMQRNCASGMEAIAEAAMRIRTGRGRAIIAGGAESMSNIPLLLPGESNEPFAHLSRAKSFGQKASAVAAMRPRHFRPTAGLELGLTDPTCDMIMGKTAELLAQEWGITRREQDEFALRSHQRAIQAAEGGRFAAEMFSYYAGDHFTPVEADTGPRPGQTMEALAKLKPLFDRRDGTVTVGNSCQITDGAATLLVADAEVAHAAGSEVLGFITGYAYAGLDPSRMGLGPVYAINQLLRESGLALADIPLIEINEAFAAQVLACLKAFGSTRFAAEHLDRNAAVGEIDPGCLNVNGGAIALGHPVGATGARIVLSLLHEMRRRNVHRGIAALCVGGGQGAAIMLERN
jgi:acetyl-CoA acetyltransferase family protein